MEKQRLKNIAQKEGCRVAARLILRPMPPHIPYLPFLTRIRTSPVIHIRTHATHQTIQMGTVRMGKIVQTAIDVPFNKVNNADLRVPLEEALIQVIFHQG